MCFSIGGTTSGGNIEEVLVDSDGHMQIDVLTMPSVTVDSEFPSAAAITDNFANPTTTSVMAMGMGWDGSAWDRITATSGALDVNVASGSITVDSEFPAAAGVTDNFATPTTTSVMGMGMWYDGSAWDMARGDATDGLLVNLGSNNDVTCTGGVTPTDNYATPSDAISVAGFNMAYDGSAWDFVRGDATDGLLVNLGSNNDVTATGGTTPSDDFANPTDAINTAGFNMMWDGATWDRVPGLAGVGLLVAGPLEDEASFTISSTRILPVGYLVDDTSPDSAPEGSAGAARMTTDRKQIVSVQTITGLADGVKVVATAGTDEALASSTACKRVIIQAQTDNTGYIAVGNAGVDATVATGTGVLLSAGEALDFEIDDLADVYIDSTVNGEGVRFTYFT